MALLTIQKWLFAASAACLIAAPAVADQTYPTKPITLVVGFPPGGPTDNIARIIAQALGNALKATVIIESTVAQHIRAGTLKALAVTMPQRSTAFPEVPTVAEAGGKPMDLAPWFGIAAPADTPASIIGKIATALDKVVADQGFLAQLETLGAIPVQNSSPERYTQQVTTETAFWNDWAKSLSTSLVR